MSPWNHASEMNSRENSSLFFSTSKLWLFGVWEGKCLDYEQSEFEFFLPSKPDVTFDRTLVIHAVSDYKKRWSEVSAGVS